MYRRAHEQPIAFILIFGTMALGALVLIIALANGSKTSAEPSRTATCVNGADLLKASAGCIEGMSLIDLERRAHAMGLQVRVVSEDGVSYDIDAAARLSRMNVEVEDGTVTEYSGFY